MRDFYVVIICNICGFAGLKFSALIEKFENERGCGKQMEKQMEQQRAQLEAALERDNCTSQSKDIIPKAHKKGAVVKMDMAQAQKRNHTLMRQFGVIFNKVHYIKSYDVCHTCFLQIFICSCFTLHADTFLITISY